MKAKIAVLVTIFIVLCTGYWIYEKEQEKEEKRFNITTNSSEADTYGSDVASESNNDYNGDNSGNNIGTDNEAGDGTVFAYICGEVSKPGVYGVCIGGRIVDVLEAAGGFTDNAAADFVNLAETVKDGMKIYVPSLEEMADASPLSESGSVTGSQSSYNDGAETNLININTAKAEQLATLPGIGEVKAQAIVSYREANGEFKDTYDIVNVKGIGEGTFDSISELITVK